MKKVLVTGGTKGIGLAIAKLFAEKGFDVTVTGRSNPSYNSKNFSFLSVDFSDEKSFSAFLETLPQKNFDILINNAGINRVAPFDQIIVKDFDDIIDVNLRLPFLITQQVLSHMKSNQFGRIINIASIFGVVSKEFRASYSSSKFGLIGLTKALAIEFASQNILCNCVSPGFIDTDLTRSVLSDEQIATMTAQVPMKRLGKPEEIAKAVFFLASEDNTFITGQNIIVDGGFTSV